MSSKGAVVLNNKKTLLIFSMLIIPVMILVFIFFSSMFGRTIGYFLPYAVYLTLLLIGVIYFYKQEGSCLKLNIEHNMIYYICAFIPVVATFIVAFLPTLRQITIKLFFITLIYAILNGTLEELFWRLTFNKIFEKNIWGAYVIPTIIFSCWHSALLFAKGISYHGGALALVGGAAMMGVIWGFVMFKTRNIKVIIYAHILTNFFAFSQLIYINWFAV